MYLIDACMCPHPNGSAMPNGLRGIASWHGRVLCMYRHKWSWLYVVVTVCRLRCRGVPRYAIIVVVIGCGVFSIVSTIGDIITVVCVIDIVSDVSSLSVMCHRYRRLCHHCHLCQQCRRCWCRCRDGCHVLID